MSISVLKNDNKVTGINSVVIGSNNQCNHDNCIMIGHGLASSKHNQLIIGNRGVTIFDNLSDYEMNEIKQVLLGLMQPVNQGEDNESHPT